MLYVYKLPIDMFYDLDDLEVIIDTQHGISFIELLMDVFYDLDDLEFIIDTQTLDPSDTFTGASVLRPSNFHGSPTVQGGRFNPPEYTSSIRNSKGEVEDFGVVLGTTSEQREAKDQYKKFSKNLKQYILRYFQKPVTMNA